MTDWRTSEELKQFFPDVNIDMEPVADIICCQIKMPKRKMGSIILVDEAKDYDRWNTMVAKVVKLGPLAFKDAVEMESGIISSLKKIANWFLPKKYQLKCELKDWIEGKWADVGDYVVIPKYGSVKFAVKVDGYEDKCLFAFLRCKDIRAKITGNPLEVDEYA